MVQGGFDLALDDAMADPGTIIIGPHVPDPADAAAFHFDVLRLDDADGDPAGGSITGVRQRTLARLQTDGTVTINVQPVERIRLATWMDPIDYWVSWGRKMAMPTVEVLDKSGK